MARSIGANQRVAVTLTPVALDADSRTFRFAQTLADAGFRSIVMEGRPSERHFWNKAIEVRSIRWTSATKPAQLRNAVRSMRQGRMGAAGEALLYLSFRVHDWWRYCQQPRFMMPAADLYMLHSFELYRAVAPLARRLGASILYDAHDFYRRIDPPEQQTEFDRKRIYPFRRRLEDRLVSVADGFTTVSNGLAGLMAQEFSRRPDVIRNCHDERYDRAGVRPLRNSLGLSDADRLAVVVGNYKAGLAIHAAAGALQHLPKNIHLAFLGRGYEAIAGKLESGLVGKRLHLCHAVPPDEVVPSIRGADLGLVLYEPYSDNYRNALPNGFFQLVAAGLPIVRGKLLEIETEIGDYAIGYCLPKLEPIGIAQAISRSLEECVVLRANAAVLSRNLRWESEARKLRRLVDLILAAPTSPSRQWQ